MAAEAGEAGNAVTGDRVNPLASTRTAVTEDLDGILGTMTDAAAQKRQRTSRQVADAMAGTMLAHYRIERLLGQGGMGQVYLATDTALDRPVAIKILPGVVADNRKLRQRFYREARFQARLQHPNICHIYFVGEQDGYTFFAMELIDGESLQQRLDRDGPMPFEDALELCRMAALGLREAQAQGFTHRDIKPSNLMIDRNGVVKVVDFGLIKQAEEVTTDESAPGDEQIAPSAQRNERADRSTDNVIKTAVVGTPLYMAPEQAEGGAIDFRSDIYALGATLHQLITGTPPFVSDSVEELMFRHATDSRPQITQDNRRRSSLDTLCDRMMAKDPDQRFASYDELITAMDRVSPSRARPVGFWPRAFAMAIDFLLILFLALPATVLLNALGGESAEDGLIWLTAMIYLTLSHARWGRTLGKSMLEIAVVPAMGAQRISYPRAALRCAVQWSPAMAAAVIDPLIGLLHLPSLAHRLTATAIFVTIVLVLLYEMVVGLRRSPSKLMPWDRVAGTQVVYGQVERKKRNPSKSTGKGQGKNRDRSKNKSETMNPPDAIS